MGSPSRPGPGGGERAFECIRESLNTLGTRSANLERKPGVSSSVSNLNDFMRLRIDSTGKHAAGLGSMSHIFQKEVKHGNFDVEKLKALRPEKRKGKWFSLQEMSNRLAKVREIEDREREKMMSGKMPGILPRDVLKGVTSMIKDSSMKSDQKAQQRKQFIWFCLIYSMS